MFREQCTLSATIPICKRFERRLISGFQHIEVLPAPRGREIVSTIMRYIRGCRHAYQFREHQALCCRSLCFAQCIYTTCGGLPVHGLVRGGLIQRLAASVYREPYHPRRICGHAPDRKVRIASETLGFNTHGYGERGFSAVCIKTARPPLPTQARSEFRPIIRTETAAILFHSILYITLTPVPNILN